MWVRFDFIFYKSIDAQVNISRDFNMNKYFKKINPKSCICFIMICVIYICSPRVGAEENTANKQFENQKDMKLFSLSKSVKAFLFHVDSEGSSQKWNNSVDEDHERIRMQLYEKDLVYAKEIKDPSGKKYLMIPYVDSNAKKENHFFILPAEMSGQIKPSYEPVLPGEKRMGALFSNQEDSYVYLDKPGNDVYPLTKTPDFKNTQQCIKGVEGDSRCTGWPSSQEKLKVIKTQVVSSIDPFTQQKKLNLKYLVETQYTRPVCDYKGPEADKQMDPMKCPLSKFKVQGWIPAENVIDFKRDQTAQEDIVAFNAAQMVKLNNKLEATQKKCELGQNKSSKNIQDQMPILKAAQKPSIKFEEFGKCLGGNYPQDIRTTYAKINSMHFDPPEANVVAKNNASANPEENLETLKAREIKKGLNNLWTSNYQQNGDTPFDQFVRKHWEQKIDAKKSNSEEIEKKMAVDALARSLYGEMRGSPKDSSSYLKTTARVILNRAALLKKEGAGIRNFISEKSIQQVGDLKTQSVFKILPHVISSPKQISSWNVDDPNLIVNLCPNPKSEEEKIAWKMAVDVASEAVYKTNKFLDETKCIPYLYYTSNLVPSWADTIKSVDPEPLAQKECLSMSLNKRYLMLWNEGPLTEKIKNEVNPDQKYFSYYLKNKKTKVAQSQFSL
jgi:hypothetical protein